MSGGVWEYVIDVMTNENGQPISGKNASNHSCLIGPYGEGENLKIGYAWPIKRYYESYKYSLTRHEFSNRILGDRELGSFNVDYLISWYLEFIRGTDTNFPWIVRGRETISN